MISVELIGNIIEEKIADTGIFVVEIKISVNNNISVVIDSLEGVNIKSCISLSREIEQSLDRDVEDFELVVSSFGLDQPFKVLAHYQKNVGSEVEVIDGNGKKVTGILYMVSEKEFAINKEVREKIEGKKKKQVVKKEFVFNYDDIKSTRLKISFK